MYSEWLLLSSRVLVIHYAHLKANPGAELRRVHDYFRLPVTAKRLKCVDVLMFENTKRDAKGGWKPTSELDWGTDVMLKVRQTLDRMDKILVQTGHDKMPRG